MSGKKKPMGGKIVLSVPKLVVCDAILVASSFRAFQEMLPSSFGGGDTSFLHHAFVYLNSWKGLSLHSNITEYIWEFFSFRR